MCDGRRFDAALFKCPRLLVVAADVGALDRPPWLARLVGPMSVPHRAVVDDD
jgi:hypothetical protein